MLEAVIFDMDGVIVDSEPGYLVAMNQFLKQYGKSVDEKYCEQFFGSSNFDTWNTIKKHVGLDHLTVEECVAGMEKERRKAIEKEGYQAILGTVPLIKDLHKKGVRMAVASSSKMEEILRVTKALGVHQCFENFTSGVDECENAKPFPDVFLKAAEKLKTEPEHCLVIEDSNNGVLAAKRAGMKVIGFRNPECGNQQLKDADYVVTSMENVDYELCVQVKRD